MVAPFLSLVGGLGDLWPWPGGASPAAAAVLGGGGLLAVITTGPPESAMTFAASAPNAPVAPVMTAVLPLTLNSDSGSFRKSSDIVSPFPGCHAREGGHPVVASLVVYWIARLRGR